MGSRRKTWRQGLRKALQNKATSSAPKSHFRITPAKLTRYIELVSMFFEQGRRDPNEREEKAMLSVARMMLAAPLGRTGANANRKPVERKSS